MSSYLPTFGPILPVAPPIHLSSPFGAQPPVLPSTITQATPQVGSSPGGASTRGPHRLAAVARCPRAWAFRYLMQYKPKREPAFKMIGTLFHLCAAYHHASKMAPPPAWLAERTLEDRLREIGAGYPEEVQAAWDMYQAYIVHDSARAWVPLAVEQEFIARLGDLDPALPADLHEEEVSVRIDLEVLVNGTRRLVDHKTRNPRGERLGAWNNRVEFAEHGWQIMLQLHVVRHWYAKQFGVGDLRAEMGTPIIQRAKRARPFEFDHNPLLVPAPAYREAPRTAASFVRLERLYKQVYDAGEPLPANWSSCQGRYGPCDYLAVCHAETRDERLWILETNFTTEADK